jgi:hypothetical protein
MSSPRIFLAALFAAACLPAAAQASTVELKADGTLTVRATAGETNNIHIKPEGVPGVRVRDFGAPLRALGTGCLPSGNEIVCRSGVTRVDVALGDGNDLYIGQHGFPTIAAGEAGNDSYFHDGKTGVTTTRTDFRGGDGEDTAAYSPASAGVIVTKDGVANDGRTLTGTTVIDRDNIRLDVERLIGSSHNDSLNGSSVAPFPGKLLEQFVGGAGSDIMTGGPSDDFFDMSSPADGGDFIRGGGGQDTVSYARRTAPVVVTVGHGTRDDGEAGEGDDVIGVERVFGGRADDTVVQLPGSTLGLQVFGGAGNDSLLGASGADLLDGGSGLDTLIAGLGADTILAGDGERDSIDCGGSVDSATTDVRENSIKGCESSSVGKLALRASGSDVRVSWTHPKAWRKLRTVTVRVLDAEREIGTVTIDPKRSRLSADGAVELGRSRLSREGKTVSARLKLKVDAAFAHRKLAYAVEAVDVDGRRQVER